MEITKSYINYIPISYLPTPPLSQPSYALEETVSLKLRIFYNVIYMAINNLFF